MFRLFLSGVPPLEATHSVAFSVFGTPGTPGTHGTPDLRRVDAFSPHALYLVDLQRAMAAVTGVHFSP